MRLSELIESLQEIKDSSGDLDVFIWDALDEDKSEMSDENIQLSTLSGVNTVTIGGW